MNQPSERPACGSSTTESRWDRWQAWWRGLTDEQRQQIRDKAKWEHMTLMAVSRDWFKEWGAPL